MKSVKDTVKYYFESDKLTQDEIKNSVKLLCENNRMVLFEFKKEVINEKKSYFTYKREKDNITSKSINMDDI